MAALEDIGAESEGDSAPACGSEADPRDVFFGSFENDHTLLAEIRPLLAKEYSALASLMFAAIASWLSPFPGGAELGLLLGVAVYFAIVAPRPNSNPLSTETTFWPRSAVA